jgi:hypothetical protein
MGRQGIQGAVIDKDPPSDPTDKDRHLIDCVDYVLLDSPRFIDPHAGWPEFNLIYPKSAY